MELAAALYPCYDNHHGEKIAAVNLRYPQAKIDLLENHVCQHRRVYMRYERNTEQ